jgi:hypothetical protein
MQAPAAMPGLFFAALCEHIELRHTWTLMKIKFWQFEYDFDRDDAKIIVPIILLLVVVTTTPVNPLWVLGAAAVYFLLLFFFKQAIAAVERFLAWQRMRCPKCKNRKIYLQGYDTHNSDEHHAFYFCDNCKTTSILTSGGMLKV